MEFLNSYLLSILGVVLITVLIDLVLPDGKINKYIKSIVAIVVVAVILSPVAKLALPDFDFTEYFRTAGYEINEEALNNISSSQIAILNKDIEEKLEKLGFLGVHVTICTKSSQNPEIKYIYVDLADLVINKNEEHIDYYTKIRESILEFVTNIKEDQIIVYG